MLELPVTLGVKSLVDNDRSVSKPKSKTTDSFAEEFDVLI